MSFKTVTDEYGNESSEYDYGERRGRKKGSKARSSKTVSAQAGNWHVETDDNGVKHYIIDKADSTSTGGGRRKGSKDTVQRKERSDKGSTRDEYDYSNTHVEPDYNEERPTRASDKNRIRELRSQYYNYLEQMRAAGKPAVSEKEYIQNGLKSDYYNRHLDIYYENQRAFKNVYNEALQYIDAADFIDYMPVEKRAEFFRELEPVKQAFPKGSKQYSNLSVEKFDKVLNDFGFMQIDKHDKGFMGLKDIINMRISPVEFLGDKSQNIPSFYESYKNDVIDNKSLASDFEEEYDNELDFDLADDDWDSASDFEDDSDWEEDDSDWEEVKEDSLWWDDYEDDDTEKYPWPEKKAKKTISRYNPKIEDWRERSKNPNMKAIEDIDIDDLPIYDASGMYITGGNVENVRTKFPVKEMPRQVDLREYHEYKDKPLTGTEKRNVKQYNKDKEKAASNERIKNAAQSNYKIEHLVTDALLGLGREAD